MSRLGNLVIKIPSKTKIIIKYRLCVITGPLGSLYQTIPKYIRLLMTETGIILESLDLKRKENEKIRLQEYSGLIISKKI
jgi:ribosomal protein L6P/L9E